MIQEDKQRALDKETQEKLAERLAVHADCEWQYMTEISSDILQYLHTLGYGKLDKAWEVWQEEKDKEFKTFYEVAKEEGKREQFNVCLSELIQADGAGDLRTLERNITDLLYHWQALKSELEEGA